MVEISEGASPGISDGRCSRMARKTSNVEESEIGWTERLGSLLIAEARRGSATARDAFFSSLRVSSSEDRVSVILPSVIATISLRAAAALSNFWNFFNLKALFVASASSSARSERESNFLSVFLKGISTRRRKEIHRALYLVILTDLNRASPAEVSASTNRGAIAIGAAAEAVDVVCACCRGPLVREEKYLEVENGTGKSFGAKPLRNSPRPTGHPPHAFEYEYQ
jgi:hypothetical protein